MDVSARSLGALALAIGAAGAAALAGTASGTPTSRPSGWTIRDLGALGGTGGSVATAINDRGDVVGYSDWTPAPGRGPFTCPRRHAFLWRDGRMRDLGTLGGRSEALALNERGQIVGWSSSAIRTARRAVIWENGAIRPLGEPDTTRPIGGIVATGINEQGEISGYWWFADRKAQAGEACVGPGAGRAFLWRRGFFDGLPQRHPGRRAVAHGINDSGLLVGADVVPLWWSDAGNHGGWGTMRGGFYGVNRQGVAVGEAYAPASGRTASGDPIAHAVRWENGKPRDLGTLGGTTSSANAVNDRGRVVGVSSLKHDAGQHAFLWENGRMRDLGTLPGDTTSAATGIDSRDRVVGWSRDDRGNSHAVLWTPEVRR